MQTRLPQRRIIQLLAQKLSGQVAFLSLVLILFAATSIVGPASSARSWAQTGCRSVALSNGLPHTYDFGGGITGWYSQTINQSSILWWRAGVRGGFKPGASNYWDQIHMTRASFVDNWWARASWTCGGDGFYSATQQIKFNSRRIEDEDHLTAWHVKHIIVHEFGHILGLDHTPYGCGVSVMKSDANVGDRSCSAQTPPWSDDMKGYHALYG